MLGRGIKGLCCCLLLGFEDLEVKFWKKNAHQID